MRNQFDKILNWYFSKSALPYWCIILIDCASMMASGVLTYWLFTNTQTLYDDTLRVFCEDAFRGRARYSTGIGRSLIVSDLLIHLNKE